MPSVIPGFEYDIFISYRHNDNRSGWVSDFVNALEEELAATIKEPLSIYFDKNPYDGLLETDHVGRSLEGKLNCFIFIPIISQTYCDPKSFAWQHEFLVFNRLSALDKFGSHIKLNNGHVTSRILPVKIHDLDTEDKALIEHEIGGVVRAIEFIFRSSGVNRPLHPHEEHPHDNLNKTFYRDQINKVANAIKSIVHAGSANTPPVPSSLMQTTGAPHKPSRKIVSWIAIAVVLIAGAIWIYNTRSDGTSSTATTDTSDKSLVVLPFSDISPAKDQEWFSDGLTEELLNSLTSLKDLKLISRTTSFSFKNKGISAKRIADSLGVAHVLEGSVRKSNDQLRITVQLINAHDDSHLWSHTYDYTIDSVFKIQEDISVNVANTLNLLLDDDIRKAMSDVGTTNVDAYQQYLKGMAIYRDAHSKGNFNLLMEANKYLENALQISPNFVQVYFDHADLYSHSLLAGGNLECLKHLSEKQQYELMMNDLNRAIALSENNSDKIGYSFTRDIFSPDWSRLPSYLKITEPWSSGWEVFLTLIDPQFGVDRYVKYVDNEPYLDMLRYFAALTLANKNELDSALLLYKVDITKSYINARTKSFLFFRHREYGKADDAFAAFRNNNDSYSVFVDILNGRLQKNDPELDRLLSSEPLIDTYGYSPLLAYNALGQYDRADSIAALLDKRLLGHFSLCYTVLQFGLHFHLSATPNFRDRLRELGIDPAEFEKKHYKRISI